MKTDDSKILVIQGLVAQMFGLQAEELSRDRRKRAVTMPPQIAMYLAKQETGASLAEIGMLFGGRHHSTVTHAIHRVETMRHADAATNRLIESVQVNLKSSALPPCL